MDMDGRERAGFGGNTLTATPSIWHTRDEERRIGGQGGGGAPEYVQMVGWRIRRHLHLEGRRRIACKVHVVEIGRKVMALWCVLLVLRHFIFFKRPLGLHHGR